MKLELKNICQSYDGKSIIKNMNLEFEPGIYGFLGPNGAGKSTTIRMICTVENPVSGEICYGGKDIYAMGADYRGKLGYVSQKAGYYPDYKAEVFLRYVARLKDIAEEEKRIEECLKLVNLWDARKKKIRTFSGGMKQRLNIAQALLNEPEILILDEPTVGLDPNERMNLKNLLTEFASEKIVIFATHIVSDVEDIADRVMILVRGKIRFNEYTEVALQQMADTVWECKLNDIEKIKYIREHYKISKMQRHKGSVDLRVISDTKPCEEAVQVQGSLEELYMRLVG